MAYKGTELLQTARTCLGKSYGSKFEGYTMDCSGLIAYCLKKRFNISSSTIGCGCKQQWEYFSSKSHRGRVLYRSSSMNGKGKDISSSQVKEGDLLYKFYYDGVNHHAMIANGSGGTIDASGGTGAVREKQPYAWAYKDVDLWVRMYEDNAQNATTTTNMQDEANKSSSSVTPSGSNIASGNVQNPAASSPVISSVTDGTGNPNSSGDNSSVSSNVTSSYNYDFSYVLAGGLPLTSVDTYRGAMVKILNKINSSENLVYNGATLRGYSMGFLYDLTHGGYFKFLLPEFSESYQANYETIQIPGRSSDVQSYHGTSSPSKTVTLQLMAGEGLYKGSDPVGALHKDLDFVKSLNYPDYQSAIVKPPSIVLLYLGPTSILKGVVTSVSINSRKPYTVDGRPMYVELTFTVVQATDNPPDYKDVRNKSVVSF